MSEPIFHKGKISASVKQVCCDGVLQTMELPLLYSSLVDLSILLHKMVGACTD